MKNKMTVNKHLLLVVLSALLLTGCAKKAMPTQTDYNPSDFIPANAVTNTDPGDNVPIPRVKMQANGVLTSASFTSSPALKAAYQHFIHTGVAQAVKGDGFITLPFNPYKRPIIQCAPLLTCQIVLQKNEIINGISLGDTERWKIAKMFEGKAGDGSWIVLLKPTQINIASNLTITTDKRIYNFGVVSKAGEAPIINFWYPNEMAQNSISLSKLKRQAVRANSQNVLSSSTSTSTYMNVNKMNFNYTLSGNTPPWTPSQVFDDGNKTFMRMPAITGRMNLPVLYTYRNGTQALVNYRYKRPYIIVDGLFWKAALISGKGNNKVEVDILNNNFKG